MLAVLSSIKLSRSSGSGKANSGNAVSLSTMKFSALITVPREFAMIIVKSYYNSPILSLDIATTVSLLANVLAKYRPRSSAFCNSNSLPNEGSMYCSDSQPAILDTSSTLLNISTKGYKEKGSYAMHWTSVQVTSIFPAVALLASKISVSATIALDKKSLTIASSLGNMYDESPVTWANYKHTYDGSRILAK